MQSVIKFLLHPLAIKMVDVSLHYVYWSILHPFALGHEEIKGCLGRAREKVGSGEGGVIAHVTEGEDEGVGKGGKLLKEMDDAEALMGVGKLRDLRMKRLGKDAMQKIALAINKTWEEVKGHLKVKEGVAKSTGLFLPVLIYAIRNAADNMLGSKYAYLSRSLKWSHSSILSRFGSPTDVWSDLHSSLTSILDPTGYASHLSCFSGVGGDGVAGRIERMKEGTVTHGGAANSDKKKGALAVTDKVLKHYQNRYRLPSHAVLWVTQPNTKCVVKNTACWRMPPITTIAVSLRGMA